jgi:guanylate kinase
VVAAVRRRHPEIWVSTSVTTRRPRPGEIEGQHYRFVGEDDFSRLVDGQELLEHASFGGHRYGTPRAPVMEQLELDRPALLEIDLQGARQVRESLPGAQLVFLAPPTWEELIRRLTGRATESAADVARRLSLAKNELAAVDEFDRTLINHDADAAADELVALMCE